MIGSYNRHLVQLLGSSFCLRNFWPNPQLVSFGTIKDLAKDIFGLLDCHCVSEVVLSNKVCCFSVSGKEVKIFFTSSVKHGVNCSAQQPGCPCMCCVIAAPFIPNNPNTRYGPNSPKYRAFSKMHLISDVCSPKGIGSLNSSLLALTIRVSSYRASFYSQN